MRPAHTFVALGLFATSAGLLSAADKPAADAPAAHPAAAADAPRPDANGFYSLFDGKTLNGWKVGKNAETFKVEDGSIVVNGDVAHLFYVGQVHGADFKDFHFKAEVKTLPNSNSGIYFHTKYQEANWPAAGFECQVNNTFVKDPRKTASLYAVKDVKEQVARDNEWFLYEILVKGQKITLKINGKVINEYEVPADYQPPKGMDGRKLGHGTFALQGHDKGSKAMFRNITVKALD
jgi:hypothetical protein